MNDIDTTKKILTHVDAALGDRNRFGGINVAGAPIVRLRNDDVRTFLAWVTSLLSASPVHGELGENRAVLTVTGLIQCGLRVSVAVDVRADLLRRNDLAGILSAHELARLAPMVVNR